MKAILVLAIIVLLINVLSLDFDNIFSIKENKTEYLNIVISVLIIGMSYYKRNT